MLQIYNTLTRDKALFEPLVPGKVGLYVCGVTVYDDCHLGHARAYVSFDVITRYLQFSGYDVCQVRNITDIDDKIIKRAHENNESCEALTARFIIRMHEDLAALGIARPTQEPKATENIPQIIALIERLEAAGFAYAASNGDVYYRVSKNPHYGCLSGRKIDDLRAGERVALNEEKDDPLDFVLWKAAKAGEPSWSSPWSEGRPGWHIECSAMAMDALGETFDIHGGGPDLVFPHHENEIAQAEVVTHQRFANVWMHAGPLRLGQDKMSKSLGNFFTIRELLDRYPAEVLRYFLVGSQYRSPINFDEAQLQAAHAALSRLYASLRGLSPVSEIPASVLDNDNGGYINAFKTAMDDDFNTPEAFAVFFKLSHEINRLRTQEALAEANELAGVLKHLAGVLGFLADDPDRFLQLGLLQSTVTESNSGATEQLTAEQVDAAIVERNAAREAKDWPAADRIRDELQAGGIVLEDKNGETLWRRA